MIKTIAVALLISAMTVTASAKPLKRDICGIQIPPARFLNKPPRTTSIDGPHELPAWQVASECTGSGFTDAVGCTIEKRFGNTLIAFRVVYTSTITPGTNPKCTPAMWKESILRHEAAHMAGWPPNHPN